MATPPSRIRTVRETQLAALCGLGVNNLYELAGKLDALGAVVNPARLREVIEEYTDADTARIIQRFLIGVATAVRRGFLAVPDMLDTIQRSLTSDRSQAPSPETWRECRPPVERMLASKSVILSAKAADLASDFDRFCITSRIITDIRPVFDTDNGPLVGATITHTLRLEYLSADRTHGSISVALDMDDIKHLQDACIEAVRKGGVAKALMDEKRNGYLDTLLPGQERK